MAMSGTSLEFDMTAITFLETTYSFLFQVIRDNTEEVVSTEFQITVIDCDNDFIAPAV